MRVTMVKKELLNGEPCRKCAQAEELLKNRGLWDRIDTIVWAKEGDADSPGLRLAARHGVEVAPFFVVHADDGTEAVYTSVLQFIKDGLGSGVRRSEAVAPVDIDAAARRFTERPPGELVTWGLETWGAECALAFSGAEDVVLIDMAVQSGRPFSVFTLDTGRLHAETYRYIEKIRTHYGIEVQVLSPDPVALEPFVRKKGLFSFYEDGHEECCGIRKIEPLRRALKGYRAWITGQRRDQSPATRGEISAVESDPTFTGKADGALVKLNPLWNWSSARVWQYIRDNDVPFNALHSRGYASIGCEPCTRALMPGEHERAGRWWWEEATKRECGLHVGNVASRKEP